MGATRRAASRIQRGYYGIGIMNGKTPENLGTLWRSALIFGASFMVSIGKRYKVQASDVLKSYRHIPLYSYETFAACYANLPHDCQLVGVELDARAVPLEEFSHPARCLYLLGAEDHGLSKEARERCHKLIELPGEFCLNVAVAGSIALYHRHVQRAAIERAVA